MKKWLLAAVLGMSCIDSAQAGTVTFTYTPDFAIFTTPDQPGLYFDGPLVTFSDILSGVEEGDNFSLDLFARVTSAANDGQLGGGYALSQLIDTLPSLTVTNGLVTFANAAFRRNGTDAFQLSTPGGTYITGSQYESPDGERFLDAISDNANLKFGGFVASPVPEPATWLSMIIGVALSGAMLRRRQKSALTYS